jgi:uncharacterized protein (TIGR03067 family)
LAALGLALASSGCMTPALFADRFQGVWAPEQAQLGGQPMPLETFQGALLTLREGAYDFVTDQGRYTVPPAGEPFAMDITGTEGPNQGRTILAIAKLDGDRLTICYELGIGPRPDAFDSAKGSKHFLLSYRRVGGPI